jgi:hypothetical protein
MNLRVVARTHCRGSRQPFVHATAITSEISAIRRRGFFRYLLTLCSKLSLSLSDGDDEELTLRWRPLIVGNLCSLQKQFASGPQNDIKVVHDSGGHNILPTYFEPRKHELGSFIWHQLTPSAQRLVDKTSPRAYTNLTKHFSGKSALALGIGRIHRSNLPLPTPHYRSKCWPGTRKRQT